MKKKKKIKMIISAFLAVAIVSGIVPWGDMNFTLTSHAEETQGSPAASLEEEKDENTEDGSTSPLDREYTVTFDPNGGVVSVKTISAKCLSPIGELPEPNRDGYVFLGWYTKKDSGVKIDKNYAPFDDTTVYAHWSSETVQRIIDYMGNLTDIIMLPVHIVMMPFIALFGFLAVCVCIPPIGASVIGVLLMPFLFLYSMFDEIVPSVGSLLN